MDAFAMLDRLLLVALTPLALAGGTATSWLQDHGYGYARLDRAVGLRDPRGAVSRGSLTIHRGQDGLLHTFVRINGVVIDMVVDTGASRTIVSSSDARFVFPATSSGSTSKIMTLGGERDLQIRPVGPVELAGKRYANLEAGVVEGGQISVIGLDWLALTGPITISASS